jgi:hypothetical protein
MKLRCLARFFLCLISLITVLCFAPPCSILKSGGAGRAADVISRKLEKQGAELAIFVQINTSMAPICLAGLTGLQDASSAG